MSDLVFGIQQRDGDGIRVAAIGHAEDRRVLFGQVLVVHADLERLGARNEDVIGPLAL